MCSSDLASILVIVMTPQASASDEFKYRKKACVAEPTNYACLKADTRRQSASEPVLFTGELSRQAQKNLASWTSGENTICLTRYSKTPRKDGSWPRETLSAACTTMNKDGTFGIETYLGKIGAFVYGIEMGPCQSTAEECGQADGMLLGVANRHDRLVTVRTVAG